MIMTANLHSDDTTTYDTPIYRCVSFCRKVLTENDKCKNSVNAYLQGVSVSLKNVFVGRCRKNVGAATKPFCRKFNLYNIQYDRLYLYNNNQAFEMTTPEALKTKQK